MNPNLHDAWPFLAGEPRRLTSDDLFALHFLRDARLSPDGRRVAYAVSSTAGDEELFAITILDLEDDAERRLPFEGNAAAPNWSPDGRWLAFVGDGRLRIADAHSLESWDALTPAGRSVQGVPSWSPDSARLAVSLLEHHRTEGPRRITAAHYRAEGIGFIDDLSQTIVVVERETGAATALTGDGQGLCSQPEWSPCGAQILFMASPNAVPTSSYSPRPLIVSCQGGEPLDVLGDGWFVTAARWLPCGRRIAVAGAQGSDLTIPNPLLWVVDLDGNAEPRMADCAGKLGGMLHHDMPCWDLTRRNPITLHGDVALVTILHRGRYEVWQVALSGPQKIAPLLARARSCILLDAGEDRLIYAVTGLKAPPELHTSTASAGQERRLTRLNDSQLATWPGIRIERFTFVSADGLAIDTWYLAPTACPAPIPTVLYIHGGPFAATGEAFRFDFHLLAAAGFGVLFANFRGSAGYGDGFTRAIMGDWGNKGFPDHMGAVDAAIARGLADPERLGVWGASHGGFATCWIVAHSNRFRAAVAEAAVTNLATIYYLSDAPETRVRDLGGRPHEIPDIYRDRSPITHAHHCITPTMLIHGEDDLRVPISEAEQFYRVLKDVGCETELVRVPKCNHMGDSSGPLSARRAQNEALLRWFEAHL